MFKKRNEGFTLIELMIVIAILGLLAAMVVPRLTNLTNRAKLAEGVNMTGMIKSAEEMYYAETRSYTDDEDDLEGYIEIDDITSAGWTIDLDTSKIIDTNSDTPEDTTGPNTTDLSDEEVGYIVTLTQKSMQVWMDGEGTAWQTPDGKNWIEINPGSDGDSEGE